MKKVLVTGATGFIGHHLIKELQDSGYQSYSTFRRKKAYPELERSGTKLLHLDFRQKKSISEALRTSKPNYIIHNAGLTSASNLNEYLEVNRDYLRDLLDVVREEGISLSKFVFISSLAANGPAENHPNSIITSQSDYLPITQYGQSKEAAEKLLKEYSDIPYVIIRPTAVYGPRDKGLLKVISLLNKGLDVAINVPPQKLSFIYVKDLCRLIRLAMQKARPQTVYLGASADLKSAIEFNDIIKKQLNKKSLKIKLPINFVRLIAVLGEQLGKITGNHPILDREKLKEITSHSWKCDISNLKTDLDFSSEYNLQQGLHETIQWYKENHWI